MVKSGEFRDQRSEAQRNQQMVNPIIPNYLNLSDDGSFIFIPKRFLAKKVFRILLPLSLKLYQSYLDVTCPPVRMRKCFHAEEYLYVHYVGAEIGGFWENRAMD